MAIGGLFLFLTATALGDSLDDAIDRALVKDRAGRPAEALEILRPLAGEYDSDPWLHFHLSLFLRSLGRDDQAAAALERAVSLAESFRPAPEEEAAFRELKRRIDSEAKEVLRFRAPAQKEVASYVEGGLKAASARFDDLFRDNSIWKWHFEGEGSGTVEGELVFTDNGSDFVEQASPEGVRLAERFTLRFEMRLDLAPEGKPAVYVTFKGDGTPGDPEDTLIMAPRQEHLVGFARRESRGNVMTETRALPPNLPAPGVLQRYELSWTHATHRSVLKIDGKTVFDFALRESDRLDGRFSLGTADLAKVRIRAVSLRNQP